MVRGGWRKSPWGSADECLLAGLFLLRKKEYPDVMNEDPKVREVLERRTSLKAPEDSDWLLGHIR